MERRGSTIYNASDNMGGRGVMTTASISLQDLRRKIYLKAKADKAWRFWGLYVHVCKRETLYEAYRLAKANKGAPGIDGVTFDAIEEGGLIEFLSEIQHELETGTYQPMRNRLQRIPKGGGRYRTLGIPAIRDRVVQGALKLILEPVFDADFQPGSFGYRPKRTAHQAVHRVSKAILTRKTRVIDVDLKAYFDTVRHDKLLGMVAGRINDKHIMRLLKLILKIGGKRGVPQGGVISPLLSNIYLNEVDMMLEKAKAVTRKSQYTHLEYARFADDLVILVDYHSRWDWLAAAVWHRLKQEFAKLDVTLNEEKTKLVDLSKGESFDFLGFNFRQGLTTNSKLGVIMQPKKDARSNLLKKLKGIFKRLKSQPTEWVINTINPILRGWVNYFRIGNSSQCFSFVRWWMERKLRRHLMRARLRQGFGWKRWSREYIYGSLGLYDDYAIRYVQTES